MLNDLRTAIAYLTRARRIIHRHLPKNLYPYLYEDLDYDITALREIVIDGGLATQPSKQKVLHHD